MGKADKTAKGRSACLPSAGLKADKTAKTANTIVTSVTVLTVLTAVAMLVLGLGGGEVTGACERSKGASG